MDIKNGCDVLNIDIRKIIMDKIGNSLHIMWISYQRLKNNQDQMYKYLDIISEEAIKLVKKIEEIKNVPEKKTKK